VQYFQIVPNEKAIAKIPAARFCSAFLASFALLDCFATF
jgi:hypothetical protein